MMNPTLSINGLYILHPDIFDGFREPRYTTEDGELVKLDKNDVIIQLIAQTAELEFLYPSYPFTKLVIKHWSEKHGAQWDRLYKATEAAYNPLWNKDGTIKETSTETRDLTNENQASGADESADTGTVTQNYGRKTEGKVSAFNDPGYSPRESSEDSGKDETKRDTKTTNTYGRKDTGTQTGTVTVENERHEYGNIGVTKTQELLQDELRVSSINIIDTIVESFKHELCILVY